MPGVAVFAAGVWLKESAQVRAYVEGQSQRLCDAGERPPCAVDQRSWGEPFASLGLMATGLGLAGTGGVIWAQGEYRRGLRRPGGPRSKARRTRGLALLGGGSLLVAGALGVAVAPNPCFETASSFTRLADHERCASIYATLAPSLTLVGAPLLMWGAATLAHEKGRSEAQVSVLPTLSPRNAGLVVSGRF